MSLYTESCGAGRDLVLIHGWGMHGGVWQPLIKKLSPHFRLHIVDLPGMGFSRPIEPSHLHALADKVAEQLPATTDICGWSLGGLVAMRLALTYPERLRRLVLVGATPCFTSRGDWPHGMPAEVFQRFASEVGRDYQATLLKFLTLQCMGADDARATLKQLRRHFAERPVPTQASLQKALAVLLQNDLRQEVTQLSKPTLLIHGDRDTLAPVQAAHWLAQHLPFGRLRVLARASHAPFLSHPDQFVEALLQFLEPEAQLKRP